MTKHESQITLGELILLLNKRPKNERVIFDFGGLMPTKLSSYRGFYEDLALAYRDYGEPGVTTVESLLADLHSALGRIYGGWKGGDYRAGRDTALWAALPGEATGTAICGLAESDYQTVIRTCYVD